jgi:demethylmenaquinone methyltransferase/2-methoxy-6-polyprenyl-1,4-benzoquinol methylase
MKPLRLEMTNLDSDEHARSIQRMFTRIAPSYDLMNRIMTFSQDIRWRHEVVQRAKLPSRGVILDLGAGTGDLSQEVLQHYPGTRPIAVDFSIPMMQLGQRRPEAFKVDWVTADALCLPFPSGRFDAVISGFLMRNVIDIHKVLVESYRLLKPGGRMVVLDTTRSPRTPLSPLISIYLHDIIPLLGGLIAGDWMAYTYLPDSMKGFLMAEQLAGELQKAGFLEVGFRRLMLGTVAIHWGHKIDNHTKG